MENGATAIVLLVHGSRDPGWYEPFKGLMDRIATVRPDVSVRVASLQFGEPGLLEALRVVAETGASRALIIPMFMSSGGHVQRDIPEQVAAVQAALPNLELVLTEAVGDMSVVREAMVTAIIAAGD